LLLGNGHYLQGDIEQALAAYRASITLDQTNDETRLIYNLVLDEYIDKRHSGACA
jgi:hypothetical protein